MEKFLPEKYLLIYFTSLFLGGTLQFIFSGPGIGASAAIAGIVLAAILIRPFYISFAAIIPLPVFVIGWFSIYGDFIAFVASTSDGVGHLAHLGGYLGAFIVSIFFVGTDKKQDIKKGLMINIVMLLIAGAFWFFVIRK
jgi:membrane associated rhomboid family serine protease